MELRMIEEENFAQEKAQLEKMIEEARLEADIKIAEARRTMESQMGQLAVESTASEQQRNANKDPIVSKTSVSSVPQISKENQLAEAARVEEARRIAEEARITEERKQTESHTAKAKKDAVRKREPRYNESGQLVPPPYAYFAKVKAVELGIDIMTVWGSGPGGRIEVSDVIKHAEAFGTEAVLPAKEALETVGAPLKTPDGKGGGTNGSQASNSDASKSPGIVPFSVTSQIVADMARKVTGEEPESSKEIFAPTPAPASVSSSDWEIANGGLPPVSGGAPSISNDSRSPGYVPFAVTESLAKDLANKSTGGLQSESGQVQSTGSGFNSSSSSSQVPTNASLSPSDAARSPGMVPFAVTDQLAKNLAGGNAGVGTEHGNGISAYQSDAKMLPVKNLSSEEAGRSPGMVAFSVTPNLAEKSRRVIGAPSQGTPDKTGLNGSKSRNGGSSRDEFGSMPAGMMPFTETKKMADKLHGKTVGVVGAPKQDNRKVKHAPDEAEKTQKPRDFAKSFGEGLGRLLHGKTNGKKVKVTGSKNASKVPHFVKNAKNGHKQPPEKKRLSP